MDLDTIIMHLDNFVDTWQGWGKVFGGLNTLSSVNDDDKDITNVIEKLNTLSSTSSAA